MAGVTPARELPGGCGPPRLPGKDRGMKWVKSSLSMNNGNCLEVADFGGGVAVRDSKNPQQQPLVFDRDEWAAFIGGAKLGDFDQFGCEPGEARP